MENQTVPAAAESALPAGVEVETPAAAAPEAAVGIPAAAAAAPSFEDGGYVGEKKWDWPFIVGGVVVITVALFAIHYFRHRTFKTDKDIQQLQDEQDRLDQKLNENTQS